MSGSDDCADFLATLGFFALSVAVDNQGHVNQRPLICVVAYSIPLEAGAFPAVDAGFLSATVLPPAIVDIINQLNVKRKGGFDMKEEKAQWYEQLHGAFVYLDGLITSAWRTGSKETRVKTKQQQTSTMITLESSTRFFFGIVMVNGVNPLRTIVRNIVLDCSPTRFVLDKPTSGQARV